MSVFKSATSWADTDKACGAPHQSPVNLSRSFAKPCDRLCELTIDKVSIPQATAKIRSTTGMHLRFFDVKPTAKFNGEGYTCKDAYLFTPAQHTIENIQAEAEFVALFENPKGYTLAVSIPVRSAAGETPSTAFFNGFVGYPSEIDEPMQVVLGDNWELQDVIPSNPGFYVYEGSWVAPPCTADVTWVVFSSSVTIDPSDYAKLVSKSPSGNRPLQQLGDREVFFNEGEKIEGTAVDKKDGKVYMRCKRIPNGGQGPTPDNVTIKQSNLLDKASELTSATQKQTMSNIQAKVSDSYNQVGGFWGILAVIVLVGFAYLLYSEKGNSISQSLFGLAVFLPNLIHEYFIKPIFSKHPYSSP
jgi:carbonic anhydrase